MRPILVMVIVLGALLGGSAAHLSTRAEEGTPAASHHHGGEATTSPASGSPYAGRYDPAAAIRSLTPEEIAQIERGEGAGFALPAEHVARPGRATCSTLPTRSACLTSSGRACSKSLTSCTPR
jgi:hypothetical protein